MHPRKLEALDFLIKSVAALPHSAMDDFYMKGSQALTVRVREECSRVMNTYEAKVEVTNQLWGMR
ncbi:hypothetical protein M378DRAFT_157590 [Amanita muscaria Koide BX008]|uniref:Uncharacterized protein n=1 Tax=Amanita muscaria (strain Koide BX008) TaxID=946122 RepID=A0A0C2XJS2_AMAMK|nr:hypothetical protein M378DRAFT_157590 [Amanita muscaria Koide BX008]